MCIIRLFSCGFWLTRGSITTEKKIRTSNILGFERSLILIKPYNMGT